MREPVPARRLYAIIFVSCLVAFSLFMAVQGVRNGLAQFDLNLPGRKQLIALFTGVRLKVGDRVFLEAVVGKNGWLEYVGHRNLDSFQNSPTLPPGGIERMAANIAVLDEMLQARGITLLVVIPPNKATIYPDRVPEQIQKIGSQSELDELVQTMSQHGPPVLLDLRPALIAARQQQDVYYRTDTHWNAYGAFAGSTEILKSLSPAYPELRPSELGSLQLENLPPAIHDIARVMGSSNLLEPYIKLVPRNMDPVNWVTYNNDEMPMEVSYTGQDNLPRLLMYRDSFGIGLEPFLAPHFREATFVPAASDHPDLLSIHEVDAIKPDIVIIEFVERDLAVFDNWLQRYVANSR